MNHRTSKFLIACSVLLLSPFAVAATPVEDENAKLRAQVEQLKAQLEAAKNSCVAATPAAPAPAPAAKSSAAASAKVSPPAAPATPSSATAGATAAAPSPEVPSGYKLVKIEPVIPKDNRWKDDGAWASLFRGMSKDDVEELLGVEHTTIEGGGRASWGYGQVGTNYAGRVIFVDDRLAVWTKPGG